MRSISSVGIIAALTSALLVAATNMSFGQSLKDAEALNKKIAELYNAGKYSEAISLGERVLSIRERELGPNHPSVASSLNNLATFYHAQGRYADAERLYQRSLAIREKALGPNHTEVAASLDNLAVMYALQDRYADAEQLHKRALSIYENALGPNHPDVGRVLNNLASLYQDKGRYAQAEPLFKRSLAIEEKALGPNHPSVATSLNNLSLLYVDQGRYTEAEPLYKRALAIQEKALGPRHPEVAQSLNNLALLYRQQGRYSDAIPLYERALAIQEKAFGPGHSLVANTLNNLGFLYVDQGRYAAAEPLYKRALAVWEKALGPDHTKVATALNLLALLYYYEGRYADAEPLYKRALAIREKALGPDHPTVATSLNDLCLLYNSLGRYNDAEALYKRALAIKEKTLGLAHPDVALSLNNLAGLYKDQGQYRDAESLFERALVIWEKAFGPDHPKVALSLHNLAGVYTGEGRYVDAEQSYKRALAIWEKAFGLEHREIARSSNNLAELYETQDRYSDALPLVRTTAQKGFDRKDIHLAVLTGALTNALITRGEALDESYEVAQRATSSAASGAVNQLSIRFAAGSDQLAQLVRREQDLAGENEGLDKLLIAAIAKEPSKRDLPTEQRIRDRLKSIATERAEIETSLNQRFPSFAALSKPAPVSVKDTQALLADDEALVAFDFDDKSYAWVITRTGADWIGLKITAKDLSEEIKSLRSSLTFDIDKPFDAQLAFKIYQQTFGAIADKLHGQTRLSVVTNGALTSLPLQLLVTKDPSSKPLKDIDWLVRSYAITNLPSVASLKTLRSTAAHSAAEKPIIAFADPIFSKDSQVVASRNAAKKVTLRSVANFYEGGQPDLASLAEALPQLPDTADEVRAIAEVLKADRNDVKLGMFASETAVKHSNLDAYRIVYFATHGLVAGDVEKFAKVKAEPALALTIPDKPTDLDDGLLTASEVAQLKLNADWVVLSACNTAAEGNPGAEALSGLARAFFYAGARSLVVSHWDVDSKATVQLMTGTFEAAARDPKLSHAEALRQSMLSMIDNANSDDDAHPRVWAPFVVVGEPAKVK
jgi:tetratricopeptide (TPR) repeat protein